MTKALLTKQRDQKTLTPFRSLGKYCERMDSSSNNNKKNHYF